MCNYLPLVKIIFDKFHFLYIFQNVYSGWGGKWKVGMSTHIYVKPLNEGFIIPVISFSSLLASSF